MGGAMEELYSAEKHVKALSLEVARLHETVGLLVGYIEADGTKVTIDDVTVRFDHSKTDMSAEKLAKRVESAARNRKPFRAFGCRFRPVGP